MLIFSFDSSVLMYKNIEATYLAYSRTFVKISEVKKSCCSADENCSCNLATANLFCKRGVMAARGHLLPARGNALTPVDTRVHAAVL